LPFLQVLSLGLGKLEGEVLVLAVKGVEGELGVNSGRLLDKLIMGIVGLGPGLDCGNRWRNLGKRWLGG